MADAHDCVKVSLEKFRDCLGARELMEALQGRQLSRLQGFIARETR